jgi:hypothetical protein
MFDEQQVVRQLEETRELRERFIAPVYLSLLGANFMRPSDSQESKGNLIAELSNTITDEQIGTLLRIREWRGRLTAAWYAGLTGRSVFVDEIGNLLLQSQLVYAGQGYCAALGIIGDQRCTSYLRDYLRKYLPFRDRFFDQQWAIGALAFNDREGAEEFLRPELWSEGNVKWDPIGSMQRFEELTTYLREHRMIASTV